MANATNGRKPSSWRGLSMAITVLLVAAGVFYVIRHARDFAALGNLSVVLWAEIGVLALGSPILLGWCNKVVVGVFGVDLRFSEWFGLTMVGSMANMFAPFAPGAGMRALYLRRVHGLAYVHFANCLAAPLLIGAMVNSSLALMALILVWRLHGAVSDALLAAVLVTFAVPLALVLWPMRVGVPENKWLRRLASVINGWRTVVTRRMAVAELGAAMVVRTVLLTGIYHLLFDAIEAPAPWLACLTIASLGSVARLVNITPGSLGIYEAVLMMTSTSFGISASAGMMVALVHRLVSSLLIILSGSLYGHLLAREVFEAPNNQDGPSLPSDDDVLT